MVKDFVKLIVKKDGESHDLWSQRVKICPFTTKSCTGKGSGHGLDNCKKNYNFCIPKAVV